MVGIVANTVLYIMAKANAALSKKDVELCDVASVYCEDETIRAKANALKIHHFREGQSPREVISILKIIEQLTKLFPGIMVESIGETDIIVEKASLQRNKSNEKKGFVEVLQSNFCGIDLLFWIGFYNYGISQ